MNQRYGQRAYSSRVEGPNSLMPRIRSSTGSSCRGPGRSRPFSVRGSVAAFALASSTGLGDDRLVALLDPLRKLRRQQLADLVDIGGARGRASLVVRAAPGEPEPL